MKNVLIVDDDRVQLLKLKRALEKCAEPLQIVTAEDGEKAITVLRGQPVDLVVTDIQMPRVNGLMLLAYINTFHAQVPCFVMTAFGTSRLKAKLPTDLLRFFQKPFDPNDMAQAVVAALQRERRSGDPQGISVVTFLHMLAGEKTTCTVEVNCGELVPCKLYLREGQLVDARWGDREGEGAALAAMSWERATYCIEFQCPPEVRRRIHTGLDELIRNVTDRFD